MVTKKSLALVVGLLVGTVATPTIAQDSKDPKGVTLRPLES